MQMWIFFYFNAYEIYELVPTGKMLVLVNEYGDGDIPEYLHLVVDSCNASNIASCWPGYAI